MEREFGERIKKYRREKNLTQQDLADRLNISNKTVSRWESGGGYPDVPLLAPLARAFGVTVDDLLNEESPVRTLTKSDWQNLLSFSFAIGGGLLFFLLRLFVPVPVCYLGYLGCMAYGVHLQRYYCYQSRWFRWGNLVMNFAVNYFFATAVLGGIGVLISTATMGIGNFAETMPQQLINILLYLPRYLVWGSMLLGALLTVISAWLIERKGFDNHIRLTLRFRPLTARGAVPALSAMLLLGFWLFFLSVGMPKEIYAYQRPIFYGLLAALVLVCMFLSLKKGQRWGLVPTAVLGVGGLALPSLAASYVWLENSGRFVVDDGVIAEMYPRVLRITPELIAVGVLLAVLCLGLALIRTEIKETGK